MDNERGNWTSASSAEADALCPGRFQAQAGLPEPEASPDASMGTRIHAALAGEEVELTEDEAEIRDKCTVIATQYVAEWAGDGHAGQAFRECRLWFDDGFVKTSGKPDLVMVSGKRAMVIDYKTGRGEVAENPANAQLRTLAVLVAVNYGVDDVSVAIVQPFAKKQPPCVYSKHDLAKALQEVVDRVTACHAPNAPRIAGTIQCQYCRAKATCPEFSAIGLPARFDSLPATTLPDSIKNLANDKLGAFLGLCRMASEVAEDEIRARLASGTPVTGWELKPGRETEKIVNPQGVFEAASHLGVTVEQFMRAVSVTKGGLKDAIKAATGFKGKALDAEVDGCLQGNTETTTSRQILTEVKV